MLNSGISAIYLLVILQSRPDAGALQKVTWSPSWAVHSSGKWDKDPRRTLGRVWHLKELRLSWLGKGCLSPRGLSFSWSPTPASSRGVLGQPKTVIGSCTPLRAQGLPQDHSRRVSSVKAVTGEPRFKEWGNRLHLFKKIHTAKDMDAGGSGSLEAIFTIIYHSNTGHFLGFDI